MKKVMVKSWANGALLWFVYDFWGVRGPYSDAGEEPKLKYISLAKRVAIYKITLITTLITALFKNTRILRFKSQPTFVFFNAVSHLKRPLRKQKFTSTGSKGHGLWFVTAWWISIRFVCFRVSRWVVCDCNNDWRQTKTQQLWRQLLNFRVPVFLTKAQQWITDKAI